MVDRQNDFESSILLESELKGYVTSDGERMTRNIDNMAECLTLDQLQSEYGKDIDLQIRQQIVVIVNEKFSRLNDIQQQIADLRYRQSKTYREISKVVNRSISTINHHMKHIDKVLRSM